MHIDELRRQRNALQSELDRITRHDPRALLLLNLYTGEAMAAHYRDARAIERARYTPEQQADATRREREQDDAERAAYRARRAAQ